MSDTNKLVWHDLQWALRRTPAPLLKAMKEHGSKIMVAGGFIRSIVANEPINDIDVFVPSPEFGAMLALELAGTGRDSKRIHKTGNALTIFGFSTTIQIITRWTFTDPALCVLSFDFTIARAAFWYRLFEPAVPIAEKGLPQPPTGEWLSICDSRFYADMAGKRLIYCAPQRIEESGGSMLRVLKFYQRGYRIPFDSLAKVCARLVSGVETLPDWDEGADGGVDEPRLAKVLSGLLREVDPNIDPEHISHLPSEDPADIEETETEESAK